MTEFNVGIKEINRNCKTVNVNVNHGEDIILGSRATILNILLYNRYV